MGRTVFGILSPLLVHRFTSLRGLDHLDLTGNDPEEDIRRHPGPDHAPDVDVSGPTRKGMTEEVNHSPEPKEGQDVPGDRAFLGE